MKRRCALLLALVCAAATAATKGVDVPPDPGPVRKPVLPQFEEASLPNGLRIVFAPRHDTPLVTALLLVRAGSEYDPPDRAGLASMTAELLVKGAERQGRTLDATQLAREAEMLGSSLSTSAGWRTMAAVMTVVAPRLPAAVSLMADVLRRPTLAPEELALLRLQETDALKVAYSTPGALASRVMRRSYWGDSRYGAVVTPESLARIEPQDVIRFHRTHVRPDNTVLIVAGDTTLDAITAIARNSLGDWVDAAPAPPVALPAPPQPVAPRTLIIDLPGSGQSSVAVAAPFLASGAPQRRVGQIANAVLGGGSSARLNQEVRIKRGLSYGASSETESNNGGGMIVASAQTQHTTAAQTAELMRAELLRMGQAKPGDDELAARTAALVGGFGRGMETTGGLAGVMAEQIARNRPLQRLQDVVPELLAVTAQQVRDFSASMWLADGLRTVIVGDVQAAGDSLKELLKQDDTLLLRAETLNFSRPGLR